MFSTSSLNIGFVEISAPSKQRHEALKIMLFKLGFHLIGHHKLYAIELYKNCSSYIIINFEQKGRGNCREGAYVQMHGLCISGICILTDNEIQLSQSLTQCGAHLYKYPTPFNLASFNGLGDSLIHILSKSKWKDFINRNFTLNTNSTENTFKVINTLDLDHLQITIFKAHEQQTLKILCQGFGLQKISSNLHNANHHTIHSIESNCKNLLFRVQVLNQSEHNNYYLQAHNDSGISMLALRVNEFENGISQEIKNKIKLIQRPAQYYIEASELFHQTCINFFKLSKQSLGIDGYVNLAHHAYFTTAVEEKSITPLQFVLVQRPQGSEKFVGNFEYFN